ncbi:hypothetical protein N7510_009118 [Penicillium lagena]|uniref:uncharacterized protein n=1 Tax=Penicillium lagena TaxID=94218 RepID=UPI002541A4CC|nr:uncharacterized protein N7510_009118 [Penicillium lagena]KAJ5606337.1 hypothetical protein N7510_009118 [Penicillium lagena]
MAHYGTTVWYTRVLDWTPEADDGAWRARAASLESYNSSQESGAVQMLSVREQWRMKSPSKQIEPTDSQSY